MNRNSVSLCMIVKNSENTLTACLDSVKDFADEMVIVDTGSMDNTPAIIRNYNARIYDYPWQDDFAAARNFALSKVNTDWILILDSDETLAGSPADLRKLISKKNDLFTPMYFLNIYTYIKGGKKGKLASFQKKIRLFPNIDNIAFQYSVFEQLTHPQGISSLQPLNAEGFAIRHTPENQKEKNKRNILILKNELKKDPENFYYNYLLGKECYKSGYLDKAFSCYQRALKSSDSKEKAYLSDICTDMIKVFYQKGNTEEALNECIRRESLCEDNPDYWLTYGFMAIKEGDLECAERCLLKCLSLTPPATELIIKTDNITWKPELLLGYIYLRENNYQKAQEHFQKALEHNQNEWLLLFYLGLACRNLKNYGSSEAYFKAAEIIVPPEFSQNVRFHIFLTYIMQGKVDKANEIIKEIIDTLEGEEKENFELLEFE